MTASSNRILKRLRYGEPIVVVSGLPRSGTSMAMRMLEAGGMDLVTDGVRTADDDNPRGYYELDRVKALDKDEDRFWLKDARGKAVKIVSPLLLHLPDTHQYKVLFMRRDLGEVNASQNKMLAHREESTETADQRMRELYEEHLEKVAFLAARRPFLELLDVSHRAVIENPVEESSRIRDFLDLPLDLEKMAGVVEVGLYRNKS